MLRTYYIGQLLISMEVEDGLTVSYGYNAH